MCVLVAPHNLCVSVCDAGMDPTYISTSGVYNGKLDVTKYYQVSERLKNTKVSCHTCVRASRLRTTSIFIGLDGAQMPPHFEI